MAEFPLMALNIHIPMLDLKGLSISIHAVLHCVPCFGIQEHVLPALHRNPWSPRWKKKKQVGLTNRPNSLGLANENRTQSSKPSLKICYFTVKRGKKTYRMSFFSALKLAYLIIIFYLYFNHAAARQETQRHLCIACWKATQGAKQLSHPILFKQN